MPPKASTNKASALFIQKKKTVSARSGHTKGTGPGGSKVDAVDLEEMGGLDRAKLSKLDLDRQAKGLPTLKRDDDDDENMEREARLAAAIAAKAAKDEKRAAALAKGQPTLPPPAAKKANAEDDEENEEGETRFTAAEKGKGKAPLYWEPQPPPPAPKKKAEKKDIPGLPPPTKTKRKAEEPARLYDTPKKLNLAPAAPTTTTTTTTPTTAPAPALAKETTSIPATADKVAEAPEKRDEAETKSAAAPIASVNLSALPPLPPSPPPSPAPTPAVPSASVSSASSIPAAVPARPLPAAPLPAFSAASFFSASVPAPPPASPASASPSSILSSPPSSSPPPPVFTPPKSAASSFSAVSPETPATDYDDDDTMDIDVWCMPDICCDEGQHAVQTDRGHDEMKLSCRAFAQKPAYSIHETLPWMERKVHYELDEWMTEDTDTDAPFDLNRWTIETYLANSQFTARCKFEHPGGNGPSNVNAFGPQQTQNGNRDRRTTAADFYLSRESIQQDLGVERPQWVLSAYGPGKDAPEQLWGGQLEQSPEEMRLHAMVSEASGNLQGAVSGSTSSAARLLSAIVTDLFASCVTSRYSEPRL